MSSFIGECRSTSLIKPFTHKQGHYLAFIYYYSRINGRPPAEADMEKYFRVSPPSVHQMVLTLEANGFIERIPGRDDPFGFCSHVRTCQI